MGFTLQPLILLLVATQRETFYRATIPASDMKYGVWSVCRKLCRRNWVFSALVFVIDVYTEWEVEETYSDADYKQ